MGVMTGLPPPTGYVVLDDIRHVPTPGSSAAETESLNHGSKSAHSEDKLGLTSHCDQRVLLLILHVCR